MLKFKPTTTPLATLDLTIDEKTHEMNHLTIGTPEFAEAVKNLESLMKVRSLMQTPRFSPDVVLTVAANLTGILLIMYHERLHVVATKALSFVIKTRI